MGRWAWTHEAGLVADVRGEVVWDGETQEGYLTLSGLEPNAPAGRQYQLWIFDAERDDRYPVDGGVFDVPVHIQSVTVPIRPALRVSQPVAFAVTLEPVGGVVVSDRSHLMALARAGGRESARHDARRLPLPATGAHPDADAQAADGVLMVRPASFGWNPQTQASNRFQRDEPGLASEANQLARAEFDALVLQLRGAGVDVTVADDTASPVCPMPCFPTTG